jgi:hypothetical protein
MWKDSLMQCASFMVADTRATGTRKRVEAKQKEMLRMCADAQIDGGEVATIQST